MLDKQGIKKLKKKRTIFYPFLGNTIGGSHLSTLLLIRNLEKISYDYLVIVMADGILEDYLRKNNFKYINLKSKFDQNINNSFRLTVNILKNVKKVNSLFKTYKPYLVHTNDIKMHYFWSLICKFFSIKHLWQQHSAYYSRKNIFLSKLSAEIITVSNYCKSSFTREMSERAKVVFNPFDISKYKIKKMSNIKKYKIISFIGSDKPQKGLSFFLKVANKLAKLSNHHITFFIIGKIFNKKMINENNPDIDIKFFDFQSNYLNTLMRSDLVLLTSINEGFGRVLVECMLSKIPFIARKSGAFKEIITNKQNGLMAETEDEFCEIILEYLKKSKNLQKNKILENAKESATKLYNIDNYIKLIKPIYDGI